MSRSVGKFMMLGWRSCYTKQSFGLESKHGMMKMSEIWSLPCLAIPTNCQVLLLACWWSHHHPGDCLRRLAEGSLKHFWLWKGSFLLCLSPSHPNVHLSMKTHLAYRKLILKERKPFSFSYHLTFSFPRLSWSSSDTFSHSASFYHTHSFVLVILLS